MWLPLSMYAMYVLFQSLFFVMQNPSNLLAFCRDCSKILVLVENMLNTKESSELVENDRSIIPLIPQTKRRNLGRKARRRRKTAAAIEAAVASYAKGDMMATTTTLQVVSPVTVVLPNDRDLEWPALKEICSLEDDDRLMLVAQLGYCPGNAVSVVARINDAFHGDQWKDNLAPLVLKLYPLVLRNESDGTKHRRKRQGKANEELSMSQDAEQKQPLVEPFPTMFWITHPRFKALISKMELQNRGIQYEKKLQEDPNALDSMKYAHLAYGEERQSMITSQDREFIHERRWESALDTSRGVAGIRNPGAVKCLHAHAAHFWSGCKENVVGQWVAEEVTSMLEAEHETLFHPSSDTNE